MLEVDTGDTSIRESASASVEGDSSVWSESVGDFCSLLAGRGMDTLGSVLTCGLLFSQLKAV